jgi:hypothetical protein
MVAHNKRKKKNTKIEIRKWERRGICWKVAYQCN